MPARGWHQDPSVRVSRNPGGTEMTEEEYAPRQADTVQLAVPIPRPSSRWFRHYALDEGLSMAELIRRILRDFMAAHGRPAE